MEKTLDRLYALLEQEIGEYRCLIEELKGESKTLRENSSDSLLQTVRAIECRTAAILQINRSIQETIAELIQGMDRAPTEKKLEKLVAVLPPHEGRRIEGYRQTLARLREWAGKINARNRSFIEEASNYCKELFFILNQEIAESPVYIQDGRKKSPGLPPYSLNRKV
jgi:hypothetical protein